MRSYYTTTPLWLWLSASGAIAATHHGSESTEASDTEPCAVVSKMYADGAGQVPAKLAYDCLHSVPLDVEGDIELIDDMGAYFEWQSNQAYAVSMVPRYVC